MERNENKISAFARIMVRIFFIFVAPGYVTWQISQNTDSALLTIVLGFLTFSVSWAVLLVIALVRHLLTLRK